LYTAAEASDDPAAAADLARVLQYAGRSEESERWRSRAAARYDELIQRYPEGFANHAALFWLGAGGDPRRALALALKLVEQQKTPSTYALMLQSALAAGDSNLACLAATRTLAFGAPTAYDSALSERSIAARVAQTCGQVQFANATGSGALQN
jgi:hypothetical protein